MLSHMIAPARRNLGKQSVKTRDDCHNPLQGGGGQNEVAVLFRDMISCPFALLGFALIGFAPAAPSVA